MFAYWTYGLLSHTHTHTHTNGDVCILLVFPFECATIVAGVGIFGIADAVPFYKIDAIVFPSGKHAANKISSSFLFRTHTKRWQRTIKLKHTQIQYICISIYSIYIYIYLYTNAHLRMQTFGANYEGKKKVYNFTICTYKYNTYDALCRHFRVGPQIFVYVCT